MLTNRLKSYLALTLILTATAPVIKAESSFFTPKIALAVAGTVATIFGAVRAYDYFYMRNKNYREDFDYDDINKINVQLPNGVIEVKTHNKKNVRLTQTASYLTQANMDLAPAFINSKEDRTLTIKTSKSLFAKTLSYLGLYTTIPNIKHLLTVPETKPIELDLSSNCGVILTENTTGELKATSTGHSSIHLSNHTGNITTSNKEGETRINSCLASSASVELSTALGSIEYRTTSSGPDSIWHPEKTLKGTVGRSPYDYTIKAVSTSGNIFISGLQTVSTSGNIFISGLQPE